MAERIIISSTMRKHGETGVQTHINEFMGYLKDEDNPAQFVNSFSYYKIVVIPVFAVRRLIVLLSRPLQVWWYRYFHYLFLRLALAGVLKDGRAATIYAHCPLSAKAALRARRSKAQKVVMTVHLNESQAMEWVEKGNIARASKIYRGIRKLEADVLPALDGLVFVSGFMRDIVQRDIPATKSVPTVVLPNFVARPDLSGAPRQRQEADTSKQSAAAGRECFFGSLTHQSLSTKTGVGVPATPRTTCSGWSAQDWRLSRRRASGLGYRHKAAVTPTRRSVGQRRFRRRTAHFFDLAMITFVKPTIRKGTIAGSRAIVMAADNHSPACNGSIITRYLMYRSYERERLRISARVRSCLSPAKPRASSSFMFLRWIRLSIAGFALFDPGRVR